MDIDIADIVEKMTDAYNEAILNGIEANTIVINEKYAKTKDKLYYRGSDRLTFEIPPMFFGLKVAFAELPEAFAFMLMNSPIKSKDDIRAEERKRTANEVLDKVYKAVEQARLDCEFQNEKGEWLMNESEFLAEFTLGTLHEIYAEYGIDPFEQKVKHKENLKGVSLLDKIVKRKDGMPIGYILGYPIYTGRVRCVKKEDGWIKVLVKLHGSPRGCEDYWLLADMVEVVEDNND